MKNWGKILLCAVIVTLVAAAGWAEMAPLNPAFESYMERIHEKNNDGAGSGAVLGGRIPSPVDLSHLAGVSVLWSDGKSAPSFPVSYDLRELGYVTEVKNQNPYGACWTFSAMASMESTALKAGVTSPDYAEQFIAYYGYVDQSSELPGFANYTASNFPGIMDNGGDDFRAIALLARGTGAVNEADAPYGSTAPSATAPVSRALRNVYYFYYDNDTRYQKASVENVKTALMNYGAVSVGMYAGDPQGGNWDDSSYYNPSTYASYIPSGNPDGLSVGSANHAVTVVGWNDNYSRTNFNPSNQPSSDGAWIVKNSWGSGWGDGGYFYLSYEDAVLDTGAAYVGGDPASYDRVYQYDPFGWCSSYSPSGMVDNTAWMANVFTAAEDTLVEAVSFYVGGVGNTYELSVYTGVTGYPTTGTKRYPSQTGTLKEPGYRTVQLEYPVFVKAGDSFSIVVKLITPGYDYPIAMEARHIGYSDKATSSPGQSYVSSDGSAWTDVTTVNSTANVCLKAFGLNHVARTGKEILGYSIPGQVSSIVNEDLHTVGVTVPFGTSVTSLVPSFVLSGGASATVGGVNQFSGTSSNDFGSPVVYSVTAEDGTTQDWTVTVTVAPAPRTGKDILSYTLPNQVGDSFIDKGKYTVSADVKKGTDLTSLVATFDLSGGASAAVGGVEQVSGITSNDFSSPVNYAVTAEDGSGRNWTVTVSYYSVNSKDVEKVVVSDDVVSSDGGASLVKTDDLVDLVNDNTDLIALFKREEVALAMAGSLIPGSELDFSSASGDSTYVSRLGMGYEGAQGKVTPVMVQTKKGSKDFDGLDVSLPEAQRKSLMASGSSEKLAFRFRVTSGDKALLFKGRNLMAEKLASLKKDEDGFPYLEFILSNGSGGLSFDDLDGTAVDIHDKAKFIDDVLSKISTGKYVYQDLVNIYIENLDQSKFSEYKAEIDKLTTPTLADIETIVEAVNKGETPPSGGGGGCSVGLVPSTAILLLPLLFLRK
ncbi:MULTISPECIES: lectin like domain-containing protein [Dethiosulfovibrio]|uniref:Lectin like domain-containing protein n=2 Tax=Dethiosulfovibrio TaxID=47054 RepID=A0ABS9EM66_9BACT|nr:MULTISPECIES: lectin like domain-containing protein [Dethiosulfovibrio]MCF4113181.1 lectin like domain-containing protein [Dethiosulfovibrio russensis]MCF4142245.1 lectin like domain-containing protein [Dethiosulfovibrio marinus]MCF4144553.1 lectin like domain-containing protein [Dethiosulfovibrio acidaminovorans]